MSLRVIVGVDPGGRMTGIVARRGDVYLGHELVVRDDPKVIPGRAWLEHIAERVHAWSVAWPHAVLAIEDVSARGQRGGCRGRRDEHGGLIALGKVVATLEVYFPEAILIAPAGHGRNLLAAYPSPLVAPDELARLMGDGPLQHCRSAWDVAGRAQTLLRRMGSARKARRAAPPAPAVASVREAG